MEKCRLILHPQNMGEITPKNEGYMWVPMVCNEHHESHMVNSELEQHRKKQRNVNQQRSNHMSGKSYRCRNISHKKNIDSNAFSFAQHLIKFIHFNDLTLKSNKDPPSNRSINFLKWILSLSLSKNIYIYILGVIISVWVITSVEPVGEMDFQMVSFIHFSCQDLASST